jgi:hypothetical protein
VPLSSRVEVSILLDSSTLEDKALLSFKMLGTTFSTMQCHVPEDLTFQVTEPGEDVSL